MNDTSGKGPGQCQNCRVDITLNGLCYACTEKLKAEHEQLKRDNEMLREAGRAAHGPQTFGVYTVSMGRIMDERDQLRADKAKAEAACAEKDEALRYVKTVFASQLGVESRQSDRALSSDCGKGYVKDGVSKEELGQIYSDLVAVLCDPDGQPCFQGSDEDRAIAGKAFSRLQKLMEGKR